MRQRCTPVRALPLFAFLFLLPLAAKADSWYTITSGWQPNRIVAAEGRVWSISPGGLLRADPATSTVELWNVDQGLVNNFPTALSVDPSTGRLWIGYDGGAIDVLDPATGQFVQKIRDFANDPGILTISDIAFAGGEAYVAMTEGISRLVPAMEGEVWVVQETYRGFGSWSRPHEILRVAVHDGWLYGGGRDGIARGRLGDNLLDVTRWENVTMADLGVPAETPEPAYIHDLTVANGDMYAIVWSWGVYRLTSGAFARVGAQAFYFDVAQGPAGDLLVGRSSGFWRLDESDQFEAVLPQFTGKVNGLVAAQGELWLAVDTDPLDFGGIGRWDGEELTLFRPDSPAGDQVMVMGTAPSGDLWVGARSSRIAGLYRQGVEQGWQPYARPNHPHAPWGFTISMTATGFDQNGEAWITSWGNGVYHVEQLPDGRDSVFVFDTANSPLSGSEAPPNNYVVTNGVAPDPTGGLWISNTFAYDANSLVHVPAAWFEAPVEERDTVPWVEYGAQTGLGANLVGPLAVDSRGRVWMGTTIDGEAFARLTVLDPAGTPANPADDPPVVYLSAADGADFSNVRALDMDGEGVLWIASNNGLYSVDTRLQEAGDAVVRRISGAPGESINDVLVDPLEQVWVATDFGVSVLGNDRFTWIRSHTAADGAHPSPLVSDRVTALAARPATGEIFLGTDVGISVVATPYRQFGEQVREVVAAPQPFFVGDGATTLRFSSESLVQGATVRIYTVSGRLVRTLGFDIASATGWDGRDEEGDWAASGVYYIVVTEPGGASVTGKAAVVRR